MQIQRIRIRVLLLLLLLTRKSVVFRKGRCRVELRLIVVVLLRLLRPVKIGVQVGGVKVGLLQRGEVAIRVNKLAVGVCVVVVLLVVVDMRICIQTVAEVSLRHSGGGGGEVMMMMQANRLARDGNSSSSSSRAQTRRISKVWHEGDIYQQKERHGAEGEEERKDADRSVCLSFLRPLDDSTVYLFCVIKILYDDVLPLLSLILPRVEESECLFF
ncbi:hypothetical protein FN846DRAFT_954679 [Sphaerosporella brunnea]|uniref:Secreted protein n=1 Tax=Sphaerosporella brunnea TaxID=1250544 RepID=A0A5J5EUL9_9PEZI|nr:hypothetical protein FN846DRAFT_954679 [Sphaerosporella brunnea]